MELTVFAGDDDLAIRAKRTELLSGAGSAVEHIDVKEDGGAQLLDAISSPSLFSGKRWVYADGIESLEENLAHKIVEYAGLSDATVVGKANGALPPKVRELLKKVGTVTTLSLPKGKGVGMRIDAMVKDSGIMLRGAEKQLLVERAGHDLNRLNSILKQLNTAGIQSPSKAQLTLLLGSSSAPGVPWDLTDALEEGKVKVAVEASLHLEPIPAVAYLTSRALQIGKLVEENVKDVDSAQTLLGLTHRFQAEKLLRAARKLDVDGVKKSLDLLVEADREVKLSPYPTHIFTILVAKLGKLYLKH